jgi:hypothetical protein
MLSKTLSNILETFFSAKIIIGKNKQSLSQGKFHNRMRWQIVNVSNILQRLDRLTFLK